MTGPEVKGGSRVVLEVGQAAHFDVPCPGCGRVLYLDVGKVAVRNRTRIRWLYREVFQ